jgi:hypothetical protein
VPRRETRRTHRSSRLAARTSVGLLFFACSACGRTDIVDGWTNAGAHGFDPDDMGSNLPAVDVYF